MNLASQESTAEIILAPHKFLNLSLKSGGIILHLKKTDGIELTYALDNEGAFFNEAIDQFKSYRIFAAVDSAFELILS